MTENKVPAKTAPLLIQLIWLVLVMSLGGFWYGAFLTSRMLRQCSGLQCMNVAIPAMIALFSLVLFLSVIRTAAASRKELRGGKAELITAGCALAVTLTAAAALWLIP